MTNTVTRTMYSALLGAGLMLASSTGLAHNPKTLVIKPASHAKVVMVKNSTPCQHRHHHDHHCPHRHHSWRVTAHAVADALWLVSRP